MDAQRMLRMTRRRSGLSQRELARRAGVPQATVSRIENGVVSPTVETLEPLIRACGMELEAIEPMSGGVDRSLASAALTRSPAERLERATQAANAFARMRRYSVEHAT